MKRLIPNRLKLRTLPWAILTALVLTCGTATGTLAQHAGGHFGGAGRVSVPPASHPAFPRPVTPIRPPVVSPGNRGFLVRPPGVQVLPPRGLRVGYPYRPFRPWRPIFPISRYPFFPRPGFGFFGFPYFGFGFGWGVNSGFWPNCGLFLNWDYGCGGALAYDYGAGYGGFAPGPSYPQPQYEIQYPPIYYYGQENPQFVSLYLKDGTIYNVTDYWLVNGELHVKLLTDNGTKVVEKVMDFNQLDLQKSIDVNTARGFRFVLRNEPLEQYLKDYPSTGAPPESGPAQP